MQLTADAIQRIDDAGLRILEQAGIRVEDEEMLDALASRDCPTEGHRVWLSPGFVEEVLSQVPSSFALYGRDRNHVVVIGGGARIACNSGVDPRIYDLETGELRMSTLQDVADTTRVLDALPRVGVVAATLVEPTDLPPAMTIVGGFEATLRNTTKPVLGPGVTNEDEANLAVAMGGALRGNATALAERPLFAPWLCPVSPLTYPANLVGALRVCARAGLPLAIVTDPVTGATGPLTLAGALAQMHAELLGAIVLAQMVKPGLPVLYEGTVSAVDLRKMVTIGGSPETGLIKQAGVLLGRYRELPTTGFGLSTMSKTVDVEYGYEKAGVGLACAMAEPSILGGMGQLAGGVIAAHESLIVDHEIVGFIWRLLDGIHADDDSLGVRAVADVMNGGDFVVHPHTLAHLRGPDYWRSSLSDSLGLDEWVALGRPGALSRARQTARAILASHTVPALLPEVEARLQAVMAEAWQRLARSRAEHSPLTLKSSASGEERARCK